MYKAVTLAGGIREPLLTCSSLLISISHKTFLFFGALLLDGKQQHLASEMNCCVLPAVHLPEWLRVDLCSQAVCDYSKLGTERTRLSYRAPDKMGFQE